MPQRNPPKTLRQLSSTLVSNYFCNIIKEHAKSECKYCTGKIPVLLKCPFMNNLKDILAAPYDVLRNVQTNWEKMLKNNHEENFGRWDYDWTSNMNTNNRVLFLCYHLLSETVGFEILDYHLEYYEQFYLLQKFGKQIRSVGFADIQSFPMVSKEFWMYGVISVEDLPMWTLIFNAMKNVLCIDLVCVKVTGKLLHAIGKECVQIKVLRNIEVQRDTTPTDFLELCYDNHVTLNKKNNCCRTLETVEFIEPSKYYRYRNMCFGLGEEEIVDTNVFHDICHILFMNLVNLKFLGTDFMLEQYLSQHEDIISIDHDIFLKEISSTNMNDHVFDILQKRFPKCKKLNLKVNQPLNVMSGLSQLKNLEELKLSSEVGQQKYDYFIYKEMMLHNWQYLNHLDLKQCSLDEINLSVFADRCPNLEHLIAIASAVKWDGTKRFKALQNVNFKYTDQASNVNWMKSFADTIQKVHLFVPNGDPFGLQTANAEILTTLSFPKLQRLAIIALHCDLNFIQNVLPMCPQLQFLGYFFRTDTNNEEMQVFQNNLINQNYNISVIIL